MSIIRNFDTQKIQTALVTSDVESVPGVVCPKTFTLVSGQSFVSVSGSSVIVNADLTSDADAMTHTVRIKVQSADYPILASVTYSLSLVVSHCVVNTFSIAPIPAQTYLVNDPVLSIPFSFGVWSNAACTYNEAHTPTYNRAGSPIAPPVWITFSTVTKTFTVSTNQLANVGNYSVTLTATIPQPSLAAGTLSVSTTFALDIIDDCTLTVINPRVFNDMSVQVTLSTS